MSGRHRRAEDIELEWYEMAGMCPKVAGVSNNRGNCTKCRAECAVPIYFGNIILGRQRSCFCLPLVHSESWYQTSCSISATLGTLFRRTPAKEATISIYNIACVSRWYVPARSGVYTHCWTVSTSSLLTPTRRVPRRCHAVSFFKFWIMIPESTTISVSMSSRIWRSERYSP